MPMVFPAGKVRVTVEELGDGAVVVQVECLHTQDIALPLNDFYTV